MSEDKSNLDELGDDLKKGAENAKESAKEFAEDAKETAKEFADDAKEAAKDFAEDAKETAQEFSDSLKETFNNQDNKKIITGILALFFGGLGIHKFILGYQKEGFILLGITAGAVVLSCLAIGVFFIWIPGLIGFIEGIIYLTKSDEEFYQTYQVGKKPWF